MTCYSIRWGIMMSIETQNIINNKDSNLRNIYQILCPMDTMSNRSS